MSTWIDKITQSALRTVRENMDKRMAIKNRACVRCEILKEGHEKDVAALNKQIRQLQYQVTLLKAECAKMSHDTANNDHNMMISQFNGSSVKTEQFEANDLIVTKFSNYFDNLQQKYPILCLVLAILLSLHHKRKANSNHTSSQWKNWSALYKSFIFDVVLRSKNSKSTLRTPMLLGLICIYGNVSESVWHVLRILRIVSSRQTVQNWIKDQQVQPISDENVVLFSFDNCDFYRHVTNVRLNNRSIMIHTCTQYIVEFECGYDVSVNNIWFPVAKNNFIDFLHCDFDFANSTANNSFKAVRAVSNHSWLKIAAIEGESHLHQLKFVILDPLIPCNTATYIDCERVLMNFWNNHMATTERVFAFVSVDQACFSRVWGLKKRFPRKFSWVIPVPGEWHWSWHILQAIFKVWGAYMLLPLSRILNYSNLDLSARNFHYAEDFLQLVTIALVQIASEIMRFHAITTATDVLTLYEANSHVYKLLYMLFYYLCPYWVTRSAIKAGNHKIINDMWRYWLHMFMATRKTNYTQLTIRFLWIMQSLNTEIAEIYNCHRVFSFSGDDNTGVPYDGVNKLVRTAILVYHIVLPHSHTFSQVNWFVKSMNSTHPSESRIGWTAKSLNFSLPIMQSIKQLANHHGPVVKEYHKDTQSNSRILYDFIRGKFGLCRDEVDMNLDFN